MINDERDSPFGQMLRKRVTDNAPQGLQDTIMQKVRALEQRRIYRRMALVFLFRSAAILALLVLLIKLFLPRITSVDPSAELAQIPQKLSTAGLWLSTHLYFMLVPVILVFIYRMLKSKPDY